jgi:hypothetical protein
MPDRITYLNIKTNKKFPYYKNIKYPEIPVSQFDLYVTTTMGDRLDLLSNTYYDTPDLWWVIATANFNTIRRDSYVLKEGLQIRIPQSINFIYNALEKLNK